MADVRIPSWLERDGHPPTSKTRDVSRNTIQLLTVHDHEQRPVELAWHPTSWRKRETLPPFPFQVYVTNTASSVARDPQFPIDFTAHVERYGGVSSGGCHYRFDFYRRPFLNVLDCVAHQRVEMHWRARNGIWPRLVTSWADDSACHIGAIILVDRADWQSAGVLVVLFDPAGYRDPNGFEQWDKMDTGDIDIVHAVRKPMSHLVGDDGALANLWQRASSIWTQTDLGHRNAGGFSPVLYPAVDPEAHIDATGTEEQFEALHLDPSESAATHDLEDDDSNDDDGVYIRRVISPSVLYTPITNFFPYERYRDCGELAVTSVWSHSFKAKPLFSMTLYCANKVDCSPQNLFQVLNHGLLADEAWRLDVGKGLKLHEAYNHHISESRRRETTRVKSQRVCLKIVLDKIIGLRLPTELKDLIIDCAVAPILPKYACAGLRPFQHCFLYLDEDHMNTGPLLVYSSPISGNHPSGQTLPARCALRVVNLRYWHRVSDEIHILWSLCSPRAMIEKMPEITFGFGAPVTEFPGFPYQTISSFLTLRHNRPIVIQSDAPFGVGKWSNIIEIMDLTEGHVYELSDPQYAGHDPAHSWTRSKQLGFPPREQQIPAHCPLITLYPGQRAAMAKLGPLSLENGHEYRVRLSADLCVPMWTFGTAEQPGGPFNLPPIPLRGPREFRFRYTLG